jgi:hypothetical protein
MSAIEIPLAGKIFAIFLAFGIVFLLAAWPVLMRRLSGKLRSAFEKEEAKPRDMEEDSTRGKVRPEEPRFRKAA